MQENRGETRRSVHPISGPNPTQQHQLPETEVNLMAGKYLRSRLAGNPNGRKPMFIDVPSASFHDMMNKVVQIQESFGRLPAKIRSKFMNNPVVLLSWLEDPANRREGVRLGLIDDPELAYQMEQEKARRAPQTVQQEIVPRSPNPESKPDPESQPDYKPSQKAKTPPPS